MRRDARALLWDVNSAAASISEFLEGMTAESYAASPLVHSAVERKFEIIGEALAALVQLDPELAKRIPDVRQIIAFRNLLIHGYATIDHSRVWRIAQTFLPALKTAIATMIEEAEH